MTAHEVLVKAYEKVEASWWDGSNDTADHYREEGGVCLALAMDTHKFHGEFEAEKEAQEVILEILGKPRSAGGSLQDIYSWNDAEERTKEEVLAVIQQGIAKTATFNFEDFEVLEEV